VIATIIDTTTIGKVILYSFVAGVGIAAIFGLGVTSAAGLLESLRERRTLASAVWGTLAFACLLGAAAAVVLGVVVMARK
jgi:hypothetical protein